MNSEKWTLPPRFKMYEALGVLSDTGRIEIVDSKGSSDKEPQEMTSIFEEPATVIEARIYSSSKNKFYTVRFDPTSNQIMSNDNATWFVGYLGYPAVSVLMYLGVITYDQDILPWLADIPWKDLNQKNNNNFLKTQAEVEALVLTRAGNSADPIKRLNDGIDSVYQQLQALNLSHLGNRRSPANKPPSGY
jgi:hypothetical protein